MARQDPGKFMNKRFKNRHSGFEGVCTGVSYFENGCVQLLVEGNGGEGASHAVHWMDEQALEPISSRIVPQARSGGGSRH